MGAFERPADSGRSIHLAATQDPAGFMASWEAALPLKPAGFMGLLFAELPGEAVLTQARWEGATLRFTANLFDRGSRVFEADRTIDFLALAAHHEGLLVEEKFRGRSYGTVFARGSMALYRALALTRIRPTACTGNHKYVGALALTRIRLTAGSEVGGYAQARLGFAPASRDDWEDLKFQILEPLEEIRDRLTPSTLAAIPLALASDDPYAVFVVADANQVIDPGTRETVGKSLLLKAVWPGMLDMGVPKQTKRFDAYVAGKVVR